MMDEKRENVQKQIAELLYKYFVINDKYIAMQMPDGKYIPKKVFCSPKLIYDMLVNRASMGTYQQRYCTDIIKWICLDFDCENPEQLPELIKYYVQPVARQLRKMGICFLAEFSGRRGIHLWIHFIGTTTKELGYEIIDHISKDYRNRIKEEKHFGLDLFPAVARGSNKLGKQVKIPLSTHKKGGISFFIPDIENGDIKEWIFLPERDGFWEKQREILLNYKRNDLEKIWGVLGISPKLQERNKGLLYKKEFLLTNKKISLEQIQKKCNDCKVFRQIIDRAIEGNLRYLDRLVLAGCFGQVDNGDFLVTIMSNQHNYDASVTQKYIGAIKGKYYPVTMMYLYDLYDEPMEKDLNPNESILSYVADKMGFTGSVHKINSEYRNNEKQSFIEMIYNKELQYMRYDDEVLTVAGYLRMKNLKQYDFCKIETRLKSIISGEEQTLELPEDYYTVHKRWEEGKEAPRYLVSLCAEERILTTALIFELIRETGWRFRSYSYNLNFFDVGSVFVPWFHAWGNFQQEIKNYLNIDFFSDFGLIKIDLTNFYDCIYMHSVYQQMKEALSETALNNGKIKNIYDYLCWYTENLMTNIHGSIRGVPQGPAYARVLAELFLSTILTEFCKKYGYEGINYRILRYVDDIYVVYHDMDGLAFLHKFNDYIGQRGLQINRGKSAVYERIGDMKEWEKESILGDGEKNYFVKTIQELELEDEEEQQEKIREFEKYLTRKGKWNISDANFILNRKLDPIFVEQYLASYGEQLIQQKVGRGSIYNRLYHEIFIRDEWLDRFFLQKLYLKIPIDTVNFKNFISVCYFELPRILTLERELQIKFATWLKELNNLELEEESTARVIRKIICDEKGYENENG